MSAEKILVITLAVALAVLLVLSIILVTKALLVVNKINKISENIEVLSEKAKLTGEVLKNAAGPVAIGKLIATLVRAFKPNKRSNKEK